MLKDFSHGDEDYVAVKYVKRGDGAGVVTLYSQSERTEQDVFFDKIRHFARVKVVIRKMAMR